MERTELRQRDARLPPEKHRRRAAEMVTTCRSDLLVLVRFNHGVVRSYRTDRR